MASYPASIPSLGTVTSADYLDVAQFNTPNDEIEAICAELGINPSHIDDTVAPGSTPASVAAYLDMVANILKGIAGVDSWDKAGVPAMTAIHGHGNAGTVAAGVTSYLNLMSGALTATASASWFIVPYAFDIVLERLYIDFLTAMPGGDLNDNSMAVYIKNLTSGSTQLFAVPSTTPAGRWQKPFQYIEVACAGGAILEVSFEMPSTATAASGQIGSVCITARQGG